MFDGTPKILTALGMSEADAKTHAAAHAGAPAQAAG